MTEEQTFKRLKYPPIYYLMIEWEDFLRAYTGNYYDGYIQERESFFNERGWTWANFFEQRMKYLLEHDMPNI